MYENNNNINRGPNILAYIFISLLSFLLGWQATSFGFLGDIYDNSKKDDTTVVKEVELKNTIDLDLFWTIWEELDNKYVEENVVDEENKVYGAIKGLVNSLKDPYTVFMDPEETTQFTDNLEGMLEGIGAELSVEDQNLVIVTPLKDSPAEKAGLLPGDIIYQIDGQLASEMTLFDAIMKIRGEKGTTVTLTIIRKEEDEPFDVSIVRDSIDIESVTVEKLDNGIAYLSVNQFNDKTNEEFNKAVSEMILNEPKGLIIDLRFNGGGYLDIAVELLSYLLPSNTKAVVIKQRGEKDDEMLTNGNTKLLNVPLVVLVNEGSASASEIVAGAIQDHKRGILIGAKTFGKGSVQEVTSFSDGSSLRMTIAKWFTPNGRNIDDVGLTPDMVVELTDEDIENEYDAQKEAAIDYLMNL